MRFVCSIDTTKRYPNFDEGTASLDILVVRTVRLSSFDAELAVIQASESISLRKVRTRSSFDQILPSFAQVSSGRFKTLRFQLSTTSLLASVCLHRTSAGKSRLKCLRGQNFARMDELAKEVKAKSLDANSPNRSQTHPCATKRL